MHALLRRCNKLELFSVAKRYLVLISRICAALVGAIVLIAFANVCAYVYLKPALPDVDTLRDVQLQVPLRVYTRDGRLMAAIGEQRRIPVRYDQLPPKLVQAFLATEDDRFFRHHGVDWQGILRAALANLRAGGIRQGASTITMQVARDMFLSPRRDMKRKMSEIYISLLMEAEFTKEEIFSLYVNKIFLGQRVLWGGRRRGGVFRQELGPAQPRRNGDARRHSDRPLARQSGCKPRGRDDSPRPRAGQDDGAQLHHPGGVRGGEKHARWSPACTGRRSKWMRLTSPKWCATKCRPSTATASTRRATACLPPSIRISKPPRPWRCARGCWNTIAATGGAAQPPRSICRRRASPANLDAELEEFPAVGGLRPAIVTKVEAKSARIYVKGLGEVNASLGEAVVGAARAARRKGGPLARAGVGDLRPRRRDLHGRQQSGSDCNSCRFRRRRARWSRWIRRTARWSPWSAVSISSKASSIG